VAKRIRVGAKKPYKTVYLASDPDREGEAISYHIASLVKWANPNAVMQRITFDAITPSAVKAAFYQPRVLDIRLVAAQETGGCWIGWWGFHLHASCSSLCRVRVLSRPLPSGGRRRTAIQIHANGGDEAPAWGEFVEYPCGVRGG
jgi:DNA topoisomerase IA